jgi:hypothetical protein
MHRYKRGTAKRRRQWLRTPTSSAIAKSKTPKARLLEWLERISSAWDDFQASPARDAVNGYLGAVFAIVEHHYGEGARDFCVMRSKQEASAACVRIRWSSVRQDRRSIYGRDPLHV